MLKVEELLALVMKKADYHHNGHVMLIKFTGGWKVVFGTPDLKDDIPILHSIDDGLTLRDALHLAVIQDPIVGEHRTKQHKEENESSNN